MKAIKILLNMIRDVNVKRENKAKANGKNNAIIDNFKNSYIAEYGAIENSDNNYLLEFVMDDGFIAQLDYGFYEQRVSAVIHVQRKNTFGTFVGYLNYENDEQFVNMIDDLKNLIASSNLKEFFISLEIKAQSFDEPRLRSGYLSVKGPIQNF
jgi:hypothetical protein